MADIKLVDPECDIAVATMAQLLLQQGKVTEALKYFERAAELSRTEGEIVNALSYAEATRTQLEVQEKHPQLAGRLVCTHSEQFHFLGTPSGLWLRYRSKRLLKTLGAVSSL